MKFILFVIDCLRFDCFPERNFKDGSYSKFTTAFNTPLYFNSLFMGRNLYGESKVTWDNMYRLYGYKPEGLCLMDKLKTNFYLHSKEPLVNLRNWWITQYFTRVLKPLTYPFNEPYFYIYHIFSTHQRQGRVLSLHKRLNHFRLYQKQVNRAFQSIKRVVKELEPDTFIVMGDHGEEFWLLEDGVKMCGHGTFKQPILSDNVRFTKLFVNREDTSIIDFKGLYSFILESFK